MNSPRWGDLPSSAVSRVLRAVPFSAHKVRLQLLCRKWRDAMHLPESHDVSTSQPLRDCPIWRLGSMQLLRVLPYLNLDTDVRRLSAQGHENIQKMVAIHSSIPQVDFVSVTDLFIHDGNIDRLTPDRFPALQSLSLTPATHEFNLDLTAFAHLDALNVFMSLSKLPRVTGLHESCRVHVKFGVGESSRELSQSINEIVAKVPVQNVRSMEITLFSEISAVEYTYASMRPFSIFAHLQELEIGYVATKVNGLLLIKHLCDLGPSVKTFSAKSGIGHVHLICDFDSTQGWQYEGKPYGFVVTRV